MQKRNRIDFSAREKRGIIALRKEPGNSARRAGNKALQNRMFDADKQ